jgi:site-specific recombinase XerD
MNPLLEKPAEFASLVQSFFLAYLLQQKNSSPRTIESYRDTFRLLFEYANQTLHKPPLQLTLNDFDAKLILGFLDHLEKKRHNCARSRNARLAAIHSFTKYFALQCPQALHLAQQILAIPMKRFAKPLLSFLSREEIRTTLAAPNTNSWFDQRDRVLLSVLYNTGARVSELIAIRVTDVTLDVMPCVRLHGKGRKQRTVPLWKETATQVRRWIKQQRLQPNQALIPNRYGQPMTRANAAQRLTLAISTAIKQCPQLRGRHLTPHSVRRSCALHLLQAGVDITVIALWLGHTSPITSHGYVEADLAMKERALATISPPKMKNKRYRASDALLRFLDRL